MDCDDALSMWSVRACRICLAVGVKFHTIGPLHSYFQALVALTDVRRPVLVCYECVAYLRRFCQLRDKSQSIQTLLTSVLQDEHEITQETVEIINHKTVYLNTNLKISDVEYFAIECSSRIDNVLKKESDSELNAEDSDALITAWKRESPVISQSLCKEESITIDNAIKEDEKEDILTNVAKSEPTHYNTEIVTVLCDFDVSTRRKRRRNKVRKSSRKHIVRKVLNKDIKLKEKIPPRKEREKTIKKAESKPKVNNVPYGKTARVEFFGKFVDVLPMTQEEAMEEIIKRKQSRNYRISKYKCEFCYKGFWEKSTFDNHMVTHDPKIGPLECDFCHLRLPSRKRLTQHIGQCHKWKFSCRKCVYIVGDGSRAAKHEAWHNGKQYQCKDCDKVFSYYSTMMNHKRKVHAKEISCRQCGLCFVGQFGVSVHTFKMHGGVQVKEEGAYKCAECNIDFITLEALKRHRVVSSKHNLKETANGCEECGELFPTREAYRMHHRISHARKVLSQRLQCHLSHGLPMEAFVDNAPKKNISKNDMEDQKSDTGQHSETNRHMCDACGKMFLTCYTLKQHQRTSHSGDPAYKCSLCSRAFRTKHTLTQHALIHTRETPFRCEICGRAFRQIANLTRHMNTVHETKPVRCDICGKVVKNDTVLKAHVKHVHLKVPYPVRSGRRRKSEEKV